MTEAEAAPLEKKQPTYKNGQFALCENCSNFVEVQPNEYGRLCHSLNLDPIEYWENRKVKWLCRHCYKTKNYHLGHPETVKGTDNIKFVIPSTTIKQEQQHDDNDKEKYVKTNLDATKNFLMYT